MAYNIYTNSFDYQPHPKKRAVVTQSEKNELKARTHSDITASDVHQTENENKPESH